MEYKDKYRHVCLFDFDGVVMDTEPQYTLFWNEYGKKLLGEDDFAVRVKGMTLNEMLAEFFPDDAEVDQFLRNAIAQYEARMDYYFVDGFPEFLEDIRANDMGAAVVTSSNNVKMAAVYEKYPDLQAQFDFIITGDDIKRSKPDPECYLLAMQKYGLDDRNCFVFEDSFNGLKSARASGGKVIGLATTNRTEEIQPYCDVVINDFRGFTADDLMNLE